MKSTKFIINLITAVVFVFLGFKYFDSQKTEVEKVDDISVADTQNSASYIAPQEGLPPLVEVKRQAIYQAAVSRDFEKLKAEAGSGEDLDILGQFGPDGTTATYSFLDPEGKPIFPKWGISGFTKLIDYENIVSVFDLVPALLKLPYAKVTNKTNLDYMQNWWAAENLPAGTVLYVWPYLVTKTPDELTSSDIINMETFLTPEQIATFQGEYHYLNIVITEDGKWVSGYGVKD